MNRQLLKEFTVDEVGMVISQMHPLKSLGLDSFVA